MDKNVEIIEKTNFLCGSVWKASGGGIVDLLWNLSAWSPSWENGISNLFPHNEQLKHETFPFDWMENQKYKWTDEDV